MRELRIAAWSMLAAGLFLICMDRVFAADEAVRAWNFKVTLDEKVIGSHRFALRGEGEERRLVSDAGFAVKVLGITAYRYAHQATEDWRGDCIARLSSRTDDDGTQLAVDAAPDGARLVVHTAQGRENLDGCVMSFAYWNPAMLRQSRLLNAQTGQYEAVTIVMVGEEKLSIAGALVAAKRYRITGPKNPVELWYSENGDWLGLESRVAGGRRLRYRLE